MDWTGGKGSRCIGMREEAAHVGHDRKSASSLLGILNGHSNKIVEEEIVSQVVFVLPIAGQQRGHILGHGMMRSGCDEPAGTGMRITTLAWGLVEEQRSGGEVVGERTGQQYGRIHPYTPMSSQEEDTEDIGEMGVCNLTRVQLSQDMLRQEDIIRHILGCNDTYFIALCPTMHLCHTILYQTRCGVQSLEPANPDDGRDGSSRIGIVLQAGTVLPAQIAQLIARKRVRRDSSPCLAKGISQSFLTQNIHVGFYAPHTLLIICSHTLGFPSLLSPQKRSRKA